MDKVMKMCVFHDLGEVFTGDIPAFEKTEQDEKTESATIENWLVTLTEPYQEELKALFPGNGCSRDRRSQDLQGFG